VKCNKGNIFVFSKLIITGNKNNDKVNGKLFLMIKSGPGFMGSLTVAETGGDQQGPWPPLTSRNFVYTP
jgi:hypothetical protein